MRTRDDRERREPELAAESRRHAARFHHRLRQSVGPKHEAAILLQHDDAGTPADLVVRDVAVRGDVERRSAQQLFGNGRVEEKTHGGAYRQHGPSEEKRRRSGKPPRACDGNRATCDHGELNGPFEAQPGDQHEPRRERADDRANRVPRIDARARHRGVVRAVREDSDRQRKGRSDEERQRQ